MNIDPYKNCSDDELWNALYNSKLFYFVKSLPGQLDYEILENGDNFSSGQRQLLCMARALVRKSKLVLLDEATSSVDYITDSLVQKTIEQEFGKLGDGGERTTTVLTIAHRLSTVLNSDKILVMDAGVVREFGSPKELLSNPNSLFYQLFQAESEEKSTYSK